MTNWVVSIQVEAESDQAAQLRTILPQLLHQAGFTTTSGTTTVESWLVESQRQPMRELPRVRYEAEHVGRVRR